MERVVEKHLARWQEAGLIDAPTAARIGAWEDSHGAAGATTGRLGRVVFGLGGLMLSAGILLFVAAHWAELSPGARFAVVLGMVAVLHLAGALTASLPALATTLHAAGTAALGAGIFLAGQIFNLGDNWPAGLLLWTLGAAAGVYLLRDAAQVAWLAVLAPSWLIGEWLRAWPRPLSGEADVAVVSAGLTMLALAYLAARESESDTGWRRVLSHIGSMLLIPSAALLFTPWLTNDARSASALADVVGWTVALALPVGLAVAMRGRQGLWIALWVPWVVALYAVHHARLTGIVLYLLAAAGAVGLTAWGVHERRTRIVNLGVTAFAITVAAFYFSSLYDLLGRSAGLTGLGIVFLAGGWLLDRLRRALLARIEAGPS